MEIRRLFKRWRMKGTVFADGAGIILIDLNKGSLNQCMKLNEHNSEMRVTANYLRLNSDGAHRIIFSGISNGSCLNSSEPYWELVDNRIILPYRILCSELITVSFFFVANEELFYC